MILWISRDSISEEFFESWLNYCGNPIIGTSFLPGIFSQLNKLGSFYCLLDGLHLGSFGSLLYLYGLEEKLCKTAIWQENSPNGSLIKLCYYLLGCPFVLSNYLWHKYLSIFLFNMNLWKKVQNSKFEMS